MKELKDDSEGKKEILIDEKPKRDYNTLFYGTATQKVKTLLLKSAQTLLFYYVYLGVGFLNAILGPLLTHMQRNTGVSEEQIQWILTWRGLGLALGTPVAGFFYNIFRKSDFGKYKWYGGSLNRILVVTLVFMAGFLVVVPFINNYVLLCIDHVFQGMCSAVAEVGCNLAIAWIWRQKVTPFLQALHGFSGLGSLTFPLIIAQVFLFIEDTNMQLVFCYVLCGVLIFITIIPLLLIPCPKGIPTEKEIFEHETKKMLLKKEEKEKQKKEFELQELKPKEEEEKQQSIDEDGKEKITEPIEEESTNEEKPMIGGSDNDDDDDKPKDDEISKPEIETVESHTTKVVEDDKTKLNDKAKGAAVVWYKKLKILNDPKAFFIDLLKQIFSWSTLIYTLTAVIKGCATGVYTVFGNLIYQYCETNNLGTDVELALLTTVFWLFFTSGRFAGIALTFFIPPFFMMLFTISGTMYAYILMNIFKTNKVMIWAGTAIHGLFVSPISASSMGLPQTSFQIPLNGVSTSIISAGSTIGELVIALVINSITTFIGPIGLLYGGLVLMGITFADFVVVFIVGACYKLFKKKQVSPRVLRQLEAETQIDIAEEAELNMNSAPVQQEVEEQEDGEEGEEKKEGELETTTQSTNEEEKVPRVSTPEETIDKDQGMIMSLDE